MHPYMKICQPRLHGGSFHMQIINAKICQFNPFGIIVHNLSGGICMHNLRPNQEWLRTLGPLPGIEPVALQFQCSTLTN